MPVSQPVGSVVATMKIQKFDIPGPVLILPKKHSDERGFFSETFRKNFLQREVGPIEFVQDNHSYSPKSGTVRGFHFQIAPTPQAKLVRVVRGAIMDVAVDIRKSSPSYGDHVSTTLSADNFAQFYVPIGFAHGFCTLEPDTEVVYKVSNYYDSSTEKGLLWNDPALKIAWPVGPSDVTISDKDRNYPPLGQLGAWFI
jgi:dTDP-4-dehydrorhamnose 3,5-epimerase